MRLIDQIRGIEANKITDEIWEKTTESIAKLILEKAAKDNEWGFVAVSVSNYFLTEKLENWAKEQGLAVSHLSSFGQKTILLIWGDTPAMYGDVNAVGRIEPDGSFSPAVPSPNIVSVSMPGGILNASVA